MKNKKKKLMQEMNPGLFYNSEKKVYSLYRVKKAKKSFEKWKALSKSECSE